MTAKLDYAWKLREVMATRGQPRGGRKARRRSSC